MIFEEIKSKTTLSEVQKKVLSDIQKIAKAALGESFLIDETFLEIPPAGVQGDLALSCFKISQIIKKAPAEIAQTIYKSFQPTELIVEAEAKGPYLNFYLNKNIFARELLTQILKQKEKFGKSIIGSGQKIMMEYSSPNTNKPQHIGHLRNNLLGWTVANLFKNLNFKIIKARVINDRGVHICKSMLAYQKWGHGEIPESAGRKPDFFVGDYYVLYAQKLAEDEKEYAKNQGIILSELDEQKKKHFNERFQKNSQLFKEVQEMLRKWESGDKETRKLWQKMNNWAYQGFKETYERLGVDFDKTYFESEIYQGGKEIIDQGIKEKKLEQQPDGSVIARLEKFNLPDKIVLRSDGTSVYITQDLNLAQKKFKDFNLDYSVYCVASEQDLYFKQLFKIVELLGFDWGKRLYHLSYNMVNLPSGKMKSREGTVVDADDLISEMEKISYDLLKQRYSDLPQKELIKRSRVIGLSAIKYYILSFRNDTLITFDPQKSLDFEGKTGPYILYTYARAGSVLNKTCAKVKVKNLADFEVSEEEWQLIKEINEYPRKLFDSAIKMDPSILAGGIYEIAESFNRFYHARPILKADQKTMSFRLALTQATRQVLSNGLKLLGITPIEKM